jgi:hypothetical protein
LSHDDEEAFIEDEIKVLHSIERFINFGCDPPFGSLYYLPRIIEIMVARNEEDRKRKIDFRGHLR